MTIQNKNKESSFELNLGGLGIGLMQWGTTGIDNRVVNPKGNLSDQVVRDIWKTCRDNNIIFFDTAEGKFTLISIYFSRKHRGGFSFYLSLFRLRWGD